MPVATLVNIVETYSSPPEIIGLWTCPNVPAGTDSTSLIAFDLPAKSPFLISYCALSGKKLRGKAYAINLRLFSISSLSENLFVSILDKDDFSLIDTVYEVAMWDGINKSLSDIIEDEFIIRNRDDVLTNRIYFYFDNKASTIDTGPISVELTYIVIQDREF
jgi:hypothetical protein